MDKPVAWSPEAEEDLRSIAEYISRDSPLYAAAVVRKILETARSAGREPWMGRMVPELAVEDTRERFVYSYRLIYRVQSDHVLILAVIHGRRLLENLQHRLDEQGS